MSGTDNQTVGQISKGMFTIKVSIRDIESNKVNSEGFNLTTDSLIQPLTQHVCINNIRTNASTINVQSTAL